MLPSEQYHISLISLVQFTASELALGNIVRHGEGSRAYGVTYRYPAVKLLKKATGFLEFGFRRGKYRISLELIVFAYRSYPTFALLIECILKLNEFFMLRIRLIR